MKPSNQTHHRKKYLINKRTQFRMLGWIFLVGIALVALTSVGVLFYYLNLCRLMESVSPGIKAGGLRPCPIILGAIVWLLLTLLVWVAFRLTHRIAGPAYKFQQVVQSVSSGDYDIPKINLRKEDELLELAESLNVMMEALRSRRQKLNLTKETLDQSLNNLSQILEDKTELSEAKQCLEQIRKSSSDLNEIS